jgi:chromate transporter
MAWQLFITFFKIGLFTFGGGYAMIPLIEREIIERRGWIAKGEFLELLTVAQSAPGPIALNTAVFVGFKVRGYTGALASVLGVVVPSFVVILVVAIFFANIRENRVVDAAFKAMRPAVVALIVAPIIGLARTLDVWLIAVSVAVAVAVWWLGFSPIYLLVAGAAVGVAWSVWSAGKEGRR